MTEFNYDLENLQVGDAVTGKIAKIEDKEVLLDFGYKTEGIIPIGELANTHIENITESFSVGDELAAEVTKLEDEEVILSKKKLDSKKAWDSLNEKYESNQSFDVEVSEIVKGGLVADIGLRGFIPASQVETHFVEDFSDYKGKSLTVKIIELDEAKNRVILSHRAVTEAEEVKQKQALVDSLESGQVLTGTVQRLTDFGAFVNLGGIDGLVHISELSHEHVAKASDVVKEGDSIEVEVLSVDRDNERISLSRKKVLPGPWDEVANQIKQGQTLEGTVKRLVDFGAFVEVLPSIEGLVHISEISTRHIAKPSEALTVGETVEVKVLDVNPDEHRISLSIKEVEKAATKAEFEKYQKDEDQSGFSLGDMIGDQLNKYK
ncbi:MAG TPA: 30S ribosomal protein S1 [Candidatus Avamphibacillus intestinigallinarum]|nr:30S ribosomal protein S1 [Candidatus Avamphibacillus intestinigallinarum]